MPLFLCAIVWAPAACGDDEGSDGAPASPQSDTSAADALSLPLEFTGPALEEQDRSAEATVRVQAGELSSAEGVTAALRFEDGGPPQNWTGSGECDATTFDRAAVVNEPAKGSLALEGVGAADLTVDRTVVVIVGAPPPPCEERTGTWDGTAGELEELSGRFTAVTTQGASQAETRLILREPGDDG